MVLNEAAQQRHTLFLSARPHPPRSSSVAVLTLAADLVGGVQEANARRRLVEGDVDLPLHGVPVAGAWGSRQSPTSERGKQGAPHTSKCSSQLKGGGGDATLPSLEGTAGGCQGPICWGGDPRFRGRG